jgi:hypothetical protein
VPDALERALHVGDVDRVAILAGGEVEDDARCVEPLQRQLVDRLRTLTGDSRVVVPGRVNVRGVVRAEAQEGLDRPALAVAQQLPPHAEHALDRLGSLGVAGVLDVGAQQVG